MINDKIDLHINGSKLQPIAFVYDKETGEALEAIKKNNNNVYSLLSQLQLDINILIAKSQTVAALINANEQLLAKQPINIDPSI